MFHFALPRTSQPTRTRPSRIFYDRERSPTDRSLGRLQLWLLLTWLGAIAGLLEAAAVLANVALSSRVALASSRISQHPVGIIPLVDLVLFGLVALPVVLVTPRRGCKTPWAALGGFSFFAALAPLLAVGNLHPAASVILALAFALPTAVVIEQWPLQGARLVRLSLPITSVLIALWAGYGYQRAANAEHSAFAALPAVAPGTPNALLIALNRLDDARLDPHDDLAGLSRCLDELAERGVVSERAAAAAISHEGNSASDQAAIATIPTVADYLRAHGYATAAFVTIPGDESNALHLNRGFERWEDAPRNAIRSPLKVINSTSLGRNLLQLCGSAFRKPQPRPRDGNAFRDDPERLLAWLDQLQDRPFFVLLDFVDFPRSNTARNGTVPNVEPALPASAGGAPTVRRESDLVESVALLFRELDRRGLLANTLVIVTADRACFPSVGPEKGERCESAYLSLLIFGSPGIPRGRCVATSVSLHELPATVFELLGIMDQSPFPGQSLARHWETGRQTVARD